MADERASDRVDRFFLNSTEGWRVDNSKATGAPIFGEVQKHARRKEVRGAGGSFVAKSVQMPARGNGRSFRRDGNAEADALREAGRRAAELAQNPVARSLLAAGLVTAAASLAANKSFRHAAKKSARAAQDAAEAAAEAAAENASKIGAAMIEAATEAVRRMMMEGGGAVPPRSHGSREDVPRTKAAGTARSTPTKKAAGTAKKARKRKTVKGTKGPPSMSKTAS